MSSLLQQAQENFRFGRFAEAAELARQALAEAPDDVEAYSLLGTALSRLNRQTEAEEALQQAIRLAPESARHRYNLAAHKFAIGDRDSARLAAQEALQLDPHHGPALDLMARIANEAAPFSPGYGQPQVPTYSPPPSASRPTHNLPFVEGMGWSWDVLGWFFFLALFLSRLVLEIRMSRLTSVGDDMSRVMQMAEVILRENMSLLVGVMVWYGLLSIWWAMDLTDRKPAAGLVTASILAMVFFLCCPWFVVVFFPLYYFLRGKIPRY